MLFAFVFIYVYMILLKVSYKHNKNVIKTLLCVFEVPSHTFLKTKTKGDREFIYIQNVNIPFHT